MPPKPHTRRNTGRHSHRRHTPHPNKSNKPNTHNPSMHVSWSDSHLLDLLSKLGVNTGDPLVAKQLDALKNITSQFAISTIDEGKFDDDFKKNGFNQKDPAILKDQLEAAGDVKLEDPIRIITNVDALIANTKLKDELIKEYIQILTDLKMDQNF